jgi:hypothetical protein
MRVILEVAKKININKIELWVALSLFLSIVFLHIVLAFSFGALWRDEANSVQLASLPLFSGIQTALTFDSFPIVGPVFFHLWSLFSASDFSFRILGLAIGLCIISAFWWNAHIVGFGLPFFGLLLFGLNPTTIRFSDSIRPHGLGVFLILLTYGLIWKVANNPKSWKTTTMAIIAAVLSVQILYSNIFLLFAICTAGIVVNLLHNNKERIWTIFSIGAIAFLSLLPYIFSIKPVLMWSSAIKSQDYVGSFWLGMMSALKAPGQFMVWVWLVLFLVGIFMFYFMVLLKKRITNKQIDTYVFSIIILMLGIMSFSLFFSILSWPLRVWYYLPLMAIIALCLDSIFGIIITKDKIKIIRIIFISFASVIIFLSIWPVAKMRATNIDAAALYLESNAGNNDLIVIYPWFLGVSFHRYYSGTTPWITMPHLQDNSMHRYDLFMNELAKENKYESVLNAMDSTQIYGNRIWLIELPDQTQSCYDWRNPINFCAYPPEFIKYIQNRSLTIKRIDLGITKQVSQLENINLLVIDVKQN